MEQNRKVVFYAADIMKLICVLLLIVMYTDVFSYLNKDLHFILLLLSKLAFPFLFIYISFLFFREIDFEHFTSSQNKTILYRWLIHFAKLYLIWTILYLPFIILENVTPLTFMNIVDFVRDLVLTGSYPHLWIFPALLFALCFVYWLLQKHSFKELLIYAFIAYMIGMLINVYGSFLVDVPVVSTILTWYLLLFKTAVNGFFFAFIYVLFGYKLAHMKMHLKKSPIIAKVLLAALLYLLETALLSWLNYNTVQTQMYLSLLPLSYFLFLLLMQYRSKKKNRMINRIGTLAYLLQFYAIHICSQLDVLYKNKLLYLCMVLFLCITMSCFFIYATKTNKKMKVLYT